MGLTGRISRQIFGFLDFWIFGILEFYLAQLLALAISSSLTGANGARTVAVSYGSGGSS